MSKLKTRFTEKAAEALSFSVLEARSLGSAQIETEHILLGIINDPETTASRLLVSYSVDFTNVRDLIVSGSDFKKVDKEVTFSESAQEALTSAALHSYLWGHNYIGTEHLLFGLTKTPSGLAAHLLSTFGINSQQLTSRIEQNYPADFAKTSKQPEDTTPLLNQYGVDLTALAKNGQLSPVIGREREMERCLQILGRKTKNNPVLLGVAGVGKTAIVEAIAQKIANKSAPPRFVNSRLINLDLNLLIAGTRFRGDFEERLSGVLEEIKNHKEVIVFIDEVHNLVGAGGAGGALDAANILKPALAKGEIRCIGATTVDEYAQFIEGDTALERRFQPILVEEPDPVQTEKILEGLKPHYEKFHNVRIKKSAIKAAVSLAQRFLVERHLPDSAIDLIDEASSKRSIKDSKLSPRLLKLKEEMEALTAEKESLIKTSKFPEAHKIKQKEIKLKKAFERLVRDENLPVVVGKNDVTEIVSQISGVPVQDLTVNEARRYLNLENELKEMIIGQELAIKEIAKYIRRSRVGLADPNRPLGSFLFVGPSGVGKTLVAKATSEVLFGPFSLTRFDMSEFSEKHTISRLVGAPPGYVGYEEGSELTEQLRRKPYQVILFDEIDKAHPDIYGHLLQILDEGQVVDGRGRLVNFRNTIIIMTTNLGLELVKARGQLGFNSSSDYENVKVNLTNKLKQTFRGEFLNRLDSLVIFEPLSQDQVKEVAKLEISKFMGRLKELKVAIKIKDEVWDYLATKGFKDEEGARPLKKLIVEEIENPITDLLLNQKVKKASIKISVKGESLVIE